MILRKYNEHEDCSNCECGNTPALVISGGINCYSCGNDVVFCSKCASDLLKNLSEMTIEQQTKE